MSNLLRVGQLPGPNYVSALNPEGLPDNAIVATVLFGTSVENGVRGNTLDDGSTAAVLSPAGQIFNTWFPVASGDSANLLLRVSQAPDASNAAVAITPDLGNSSDDIGPELSLGSARAEFYEDLGLEHCIIKCAVSGSGINFTAGPGDWDPDISTALFESLITRHILAFRDWALANNKVPYIDAVICGLGANESQDADLTRQWPAQIRKLRDKVVERLGVPNMLRWIQVVMPESADVGTFPEKFTMQGYQREFMRNDPRYMVDWSWVQLDPTETPPTHPDASGNIALGYAMERTLRSSPGKTLRLNA